MGRRAAENSCDAGQVPLNSSFHPEAEADYDAAIAWMAERSVGRAEAFSAAVEHAIERLLVFPESGRVGVDGRHYALVAGHPYLIVYRALADHILVIAVAHTSREPGYWRDRS